MRYEIDNYIRIRNLILEQQYYFSKWIIFILLLKFVSINTILDIPKRYLINFYWEIGLVVHGKGEQYFLSKNYEDIVPFEIILNRKEEISNPYNMTEDKNNIILKFDEEIKDCKEMFSYLENIFEIDLSNFDLSKVTTMHSMFEGCSNLETINLTNVIISSVRDLGFMFNGCSNLKSIDLSNFDLSKVTLMYAMFQGCTNLETIHLKNVITSSVRDLCFMFNECSNLKSIDLSNLIYQKLLQCILCFRVVQI